MSDRSKDVCPMCGGTGACELKPPTSEKGALVIRLQMLNDVVWNGGDMVSNADSTADAEEVLNQEMNRLSKLGYELFSYLEYRTREGNDRTVVILQWPIRWRTVH